MATPLDDRADDLVFRFGDCQLDTASGELRRAGQVLQLPPQLHQLLLVLLRRPGRIVTRGELRQELWAEQTYVEFEDSLNHAVIRLRGVLGDSAQSPRYVETVPRRGYRFIAPVETTAPPGEAATNRPDAAAAQAGAPARPRRRVPARRLLFVAGTAALATLLALKAVAPRVRGWTRGRDADAAAAPMVAPPDPLGHQAYLEGRSLASAWGQPRLPEAIARFEEAVRRNPDDAPAIAALAHAHAMTRFRQGLPPDEHMIAFRDLTQRALALDPNLAEAHVNLGDIRFWGDWDWERGLAEFRTAVELDPGSIDAGEHYATALAVLTRYDEAVGEMTRIIRLAPSSARLSATLADIECDRGDLHAGLQHYLKALELEPGNAVGFEALGGVHEDLGRDREAVAAYLRAAAMRGNSPGLVDALSTAFAAGGLRAYWRARLEWLQTRRDQSKVSPMVFAAAYAHLGERDAALDWLERAHAQHLPGLAVVHSSRLWVPMRSSPRFQALLRAMGFPARRETPVDFAVTSGGRNARPDP